jgi:16S rRNA processing protein RimM
VATQQSANITVARILRPHGIRGEVAAEILTDFPENLTRIDCVELWDGKSSPRKVRVRSCWISRSRGGQAIFHFEGSESMSHAKKLVGLEVQIPFAKRATLAAGSYYVSDLVGCEVLGKDAARIGLVQDVQFTGENIAGTPILVVDSPKGELLIPLAQDICVSVNTEARRIEVALPDGLIDLND